MIGRTTTLVALVALTGALAAPAQAPRADHVWLSLGPVLLGNGWTLTASTTSPAFDTVTGKEILGVTLERGGSGRAREIHALRAHPAQATLSFDGRRGRWRSAGRAGRSLAVDMTIRAAGAPQPVSPEESLPFACRGPFERVRVTVTGRFALRTGTKALRTIERVRFAGVVTYNRSGDVECGSVPPPRCEASTSLTASSGASTGTRSLAVDRGRRTLALQFVEQERSSGSSRVASWYHVLLLSRVDVLVGELPDVRVTVPSGLPVSGAAAFVAGETIEDVRDGCRTRTTSGAFDGTLRADFAAWRRRAFGLVPTRGGTTAFYRVTEPA